jgi:hypothetical protein
MEEFNFYRGDTVVVYKHYTIDKSTQEEFKGVMIENQLLYPDPINGELQPCFDKIVIMDGTKMGRAYPTYLTGFHKVKSCKIVLVEKSILSRYEKVENKAMQILSMSDEELVNFLEEGGLNGGIQ